MTEAELDAILARVEDGLPNNELERVADFVRGSADPVLQHSGLYILGWAHAREYMPLIASFLKRTDDLSLPAIAIRALVLWFWDAKPYTDMLKCFLKGIPEDQDLDLQFDTLQVAGDAYRQTQDLDILRIIMSFLTNNDDLLRKVAQDALVTALAPGGERLTPKQRSDLRHSSDPVDYLSLARQRLAP